FRDIISAQTYTFPIWKKTALLPGPKRPPKISPGWQAAKLPGPKTIPCTPQQVPGTTAIRNIPNMCSAITTQEQIKIFFLNFFKNPQKSFDKRYALWYSMFCR